MRKERGQRKGRKEKGRGRREEGGGRREKAILNVRKNLDTAALQNQFFVSQPYEPRHPEAQAKNATKTEHIWSSRNKSTVGNYGTYLFEAREVPGELLQSIFHQRMHLIRYRYLA